MFSRFFMVVVCLCSLSVVEATEEAVETNSVLDDSEIVIDCQTFLNLQQVLVDANRSAETVTALLSHFRTESQANMTKLNEAQTRQEFTEYRQIIRAYSEKIMMLENQQPELQKSITVITEQLEMVREHLEPSCELPKNSEQVE
jgi:predicted RNase H-like nuclease (RuvC/YqgF family)